MGPLRESAGCGRSPVLDWSFQIFERDWNAKDNVNRTFGGVTDHSTKREKISGTGLAPKHAGLFEAATDNGLATGFNDVASDEVALCAVIASLNLVRTDTLKSKNSLKGRRKAAGGG